MTVLSTTGSGAAAGSVTEELTRSIGDGARSVKGTVSRED
jgi:hypothetical protein